MEPPSSSELYHSIALLATTGKDCLLLALLLDLQKDVIGNGKHEGETLCWPVPP